MFLTLAIGAVGVATWMFRKELSKGFSSAKREAEAQLAGKPTSGLTKTLVGVKVVAKSIKDWFMNQDLTTQAMALAAGAVVAGGLLIATGSQIVVNATILASGTILGYMLVHSYLPVEMKEWFYSSWAWKAVDVALFAVGMMLAVDSITMAIGIAFFGVCFSIHSLYEAGVMQSKAKAIA